ncbi:MAG: LTA synthase family protein [Clostridiaceae bacterium]|nr:LTA synthase family protein [Clostridiaceae bacterium]
MEARKAEDQAAEMHNFGQRSTEAEKTDPPEDGQKPKRTPNLKRRAVIKIIFFFALACAFFLTLWGVTTYDSLNLSEIVFHMHLPFKGTGGGLIIKGTLWTLIPAFFVTFCFGFLIWPWPEDFVPFAWLRNRKLKTRLARGLTLFLIVIEIFLVQYYLDIVGFIRAEFTYTSFIEDNYVDPDRTHLQAPPQKRNLVFIFLESMESTYMSKADGGMMEISRIENLTQLAKENVNFSHHDLLGGFRSSNGTSWTVGAAFGAVTGLPLKLPINVNGMSKVEEFFIGATALGDILKEDGYTNVMMTDCDSTFGGQAMLYDQHGDHLILDLNWARKSGRVPKDYFEFWGFEDYRLFEFAREELSNLAAAGRPFAFTLFTIDTHFEDGHKCPKCPNRFKDQYSNVIACSDRLVTDFVRWIQEQDFYENTTIILVGDHLTMDKDFMKEVPREERAVFNVFINAAATPVRTKNREFMATDLFPTTLAAMGYEIEGDRLGLGTDLFSGRETLAEELGVEELDQRFKERSAFYEHKFLYNWQ